MWEWLKEKLGWGSGGGGSSGGAGGGSYRDAPRIAWWDCRRCGHGWNGSPICPRCGANNSRPRTVDDPADPQRITIADWAIYTAIALAAAGAIIYTAGGATPFVAGLGTKTAVVAVGVGLATAGSASAQTTSPTQPPPSPPGVGTNTGAGLTQGGGNNDNGAPCPSPLPTAARKCPWTPEGYSVHPCTTGFCWDGGPQGALACKQEQSVPNSGRTYTTDLVCNEGYTATRDRCTGVILGCVKQ